MVGDREAFVNRPELIVGEALDVFLPVFVILALALCLMGAWVQIEGRFCIKSAQDFDELDVVIDAIIPALDNFHLRIVEFIVIREIRS